MANTNGGDIRFGINFQTNDSGLKEASKGLQNIMSQIQEIAKSQGLDDTFKDAAAEAQKLESIISSSWNDKLGQLNLDKFNQSIKNSYGSVEGLYKSLEKMGPKGQTAFNSIARQVLNTNIQLKQGKSLLDEMAETMGNTIKWGISSSIFNNITSAIQQAFYYAKDLDRQLTNIRIVTGDSADQMERFAKTANETAKELGRSTLDYTKAATSFYQQGLGDEEVAERTKLTLMAQNITGAGSQMVDYLTSVWNGFQVGVEDAESYVDKLAKVADSSASDMNELAKAMSKVSATANLVGVDVDQLNAILATVIATTRQAPEAVGTAFKTVFTRINDIKTGAEDAEISLGNYSSKMASLGFNVLDANGKLRDTGQVLEQIGSRWETLSKQQQVYLAQIMGGQRQITQVSALFQNWTMYSDLLNDSLNSEGALLQKNNIYLESTAAHMEKLSTEKERTADVLFDAETINTFVDALTSALDIFNDFIEGIGGGVNAFTYLGSVVVGIFNKQIAGAINEAQQPLQRFLARKNIDQLKQQFASTILDQRVGSKEYDTTNEQANAAAAQKQAEIYTKTLAVKKGLTQESYNELINLQKQIGVNTEKLEIIKNYKQLLEQAGLDTEMSLPAIKAEVDARKAKNQILETNISLLDRVIIDTESLQDGASNYGLTWDKIKDKIKLSEDATEEERNKLAQLKDIMNTAGDGEQGRIQRQAAINNYLQYQLGLYKQGKISLDEINQALEAKKQYENGAVDRINKQNDALERQVNLQQRNAQKVVDTQKLVKGASVVGQAFTALSGTIKTFTDDLATGADKANAVFSGIQSTVMAVGTAFGPVGMGIATLANSALSLIKEVTPLGDWLENKFSSIQEKVEKVNKTFAEVGNVNKTENAKISELEAIVDEYEKLSEKAGAYGVNLDNLTDEEKDRYHELTNKFTEYNQAVITGYDEQGNAIVRGQEALLDTIDVLKQAKKEATTAAVGDVNSFLNNSITERYNDQKKSIKKDIKSEETALTQSQWDLNQWGSGTLADLEQYLENDFLDDFNSQMQDLDEQTKNIITKKVNSFYGKLTEQLGEALGAATPEEEQQKLQYALNQADVMVRVLNGYLETPTTAFDEVLNTFNQEKKKQLEKVVQSHEDAIADLNTKLSELDNATYDIEGAKAILTVMQGVIGQDQEWENLRQQAEKVNFSINTIQGMILEHIQGIKMKDMDPEAALANAQEYATILAQIYKNSYSAIENAIGDIDFSNFEGSIQQHKKEVEQIITKDILPNLDAKDFQTDEQRQALQNLLNQIFDLTGIEIQLNGDGLILNADNIVTNAQIKGEKAQDKLQKFLKEELGYQNLKKVVDQNLQTNQMEQIQIPVPIDIESIFNEEQLKNFDQIIDQIDWGKFLDLTDEGKTAEQALKQVWEETKNLKDETSDVVQLNFEVVFNSDEVAEHLSKRKKLKDEELEYLKVLESEDPILNNIALTQGRNSDAYIKRLKQQASLGQQYYKKQIENEKKLAENHLRSLEIQLRYKKSIENPTTEQEKEIADLQSEIANTKSEIINYNYELERSEYAIAEGTKERTKAAEEQAKKKREEQQKKFNNAKSGLDNLQSGKAPSSDQLAAILEIERHNERLNQLAQEKGRYSLEYLLELGKQLQAQQKITKEKNEQIIAENNLAIAEKERQIAKLQSQIVSADGLPTGAREAVLQRNAEIESEINELKSQINEKQQENANLVNQQNEHLLTQSQILNARMESYTSIVDKLKSGATLTPEETATWQSMLDEIEQHVGHTFPLLEALRDTSLAGLDTFSEKLDRSISFYSQLIRSELVDELGSALDEINQIDLGELEIGVAPDGFDEWAEKVEDFLDIDRQINVNVRTNAQQEFDRISGEMTKLYNAASKIQEGYKVAESSLLELEQVFPHITDGMQQLGNGMVQLNQQAVQMAIGTAQTEINADKQALVQKLQNQASLYRAKAESYRKMAHAAAVLAGTEVGTEEEAAAAQALITEELEKVKNTNAELVAGNQIKNQGQVLKANEQAAQGAGDTWSSELGYIGSCVEQFTRVFIHNMQVAYQQQQDLANGVEGGSYQYETYTPPTKTGRGSGKTITAEVQTLGELQNMNNNGASQQQWAAMASRLYGMAAASDSQADWLENLARQLGLQGNTLNSGLNNVQNGYGINGPKEDDNKQDSNRGGNSGSGKPGKTNSNSGDDQLTDGSNQQEQKIQDPEVLDFLQQERNRYHDIDIQIKNIAEDLKRLQKEQKKLTGKDLIANLNKQLEVLQKQTKAQKDKLSIAQTQAEQIRKALVGNGVTFAEDGTISNYNQILDQKLAGVNALIAHYNTLTAAEQEEFKAVVEAAKQDYQNFKKQMQRYDTLVSDTIPDLQDAIEDSINEQIEIQIQKFKIQVELSLDTAEAERKFNKFKKKVLDKISDEDIIGNINSLFGDLSTYYKDGFGVIQALTDQVNNTMYEINQIKTKGYSDIYGNNLKQAEEDLKKYTEQLMSNLEDVQDIIDEIHNSIFDAIDAADEAFDEQIDKLQHINDLIDHGKNLIELLYGDEAFDKMSEYYGFQQQNNLKNLNLQRGIVEMWRQEADNQRKIRDSFAKDSKEWKEADKILKEYQGKWQDASSSFNSLLEDSIKNIIDRYSNGINKLFSEFQKKLTNNKGFEGLSEQWQLMEKYADLYLDKVNAAYEIQKLESAYKQAIDDNTGNLAAQKSLNGLMEQQLKYLKDKQNLTQYDIDKANALLQIEVKRLALEQARASKTKLRLRRDSQGNYTYQYTSDEQQLDKTKDELAKAKNDLWNLTVKENEKQAKDSFDLIKEYLKKIKEVYEDTTLSEEQRAARIAQINSRYGKVINGIFAENQIVRQDLANQTFSFLGELYGMDVGAFENMAQSQQDILLNSIVPFWGTGIHTMMDYIQGEGGLESVTQELFDGLESNTQDYSMQLGELELAAGVCFDNITGHIQDSISYTEGLLSDNQELIDSYKDLIKTVQDLINKLDVMIQKFGGVTTSATTAVEAANGLRESPTQSTYSSINTSNTTSSSTSSSSSSGINSDVYLTSGSGGSSSSGSYSSGGSQVGLIQTSSQYSSALSPEFFPVGLQETRVGLAHEDPLEVGMLGLGPAIRTPKTSASYSGQNNIKKKKIQSFGTGGYTGNWESLEGRLAILDKKELVLDEQDTENILSAAEIVRTMDSLLLNLNNMQQSFNRTKINNILSDRNNREYLRQHVIIDAHFPNVTNHNEIEKAFKNLVNMASQYAYSNRM